MRSQLINNHHGLKQLLPDNTNQQYNLVHIRRHNLSSSTKSDARNFVGMQLFKDVHSLTHKIINFYLYPAQCPLLKIIGW